jgi:hypothetical protein
LILLLTYLVLTIFPLMLLTNFNLNMGNLLLLSLFISLQYAIIFFFDKISLKLIHYFKFDVELHKYWYSFLILVTINIIGPSYTILFKYLIYYAIFIGIIIFIFKYLPKGGRLETMIQDQKTINNHMINEFSVINTLSQVVFLNVMILIYKKNTIPDLGFDGDIINIMYLSCPLLFVFFIMVRFIIINYCNHPIEK